MSAVHQLIQRARRRLQVNQFLAVFVKALPVAGLAMVVWIMCVRLFFQGRINGSVSPLSITIWIGVAVFATHAVWLVTRRGWPTRAMAAAQLDERLKLASRISTALCVEHCDDDFAKAAVADANRVALEAHTQNRLSSAFAFHLDPRWKVSVLTAAVVVSAWLFIPNWIPSAPKKDLQSIQDSVSLEKAVAAEQKLVDALQSAMEVAALDESITKTIETSQDLLERSKSKSASPAEREAQAFTQQALLAAALEKASQAESLQDNESFLDALSELELPQGEERELLKALKRGDFEAASKEAQKLADQAKSKDPSQSASAKQALQKVAAALNKQGATQAARANQITQNQKQTPESKSSSTSKKKFMGNSKNCNSMGQACKDAASGNPKNLMDLLKQKSAESSQSKSLSKSLAACKNGGGAKPGVGQSKPQLANQPDARPTTFQSQDRMSESQDLDAEPIARDFVQGTGTRGEVAARKLMLIEHQVQAGLEEGSDEDQVPPSLREAHQKYFSQWRQKIDAAKINAPPAAQSSQSQTNPPTKATALPPTAP